MSTTEAKSTTKAEAKEAPAPVVVDLGKYKRKRVRRLKKGKGRLMERALDVVDDLRDAGQIAEDAQPVIVLVRQKRRSKMKWW